MVCSPSLLLLRHRHLSQMDRHRPRLTGKQKKPRKFSRGKSKIKSSPSCSEYRRTYSKKHLIRSKYESPSWSGEDEGSDSNLDVLYSTDVSFVDAVGFWPYRLHDRSQKNSVKMAVRTSELTRRMETITESYKFGDLDPVTILSILKQVKRAADSNRVSKVEAMWFLSFYMATFSAILLIVRMTPRKDSGDYIIKWRGVERLQSRTC